MQEHLGRKDRTDLSAVKGVAFDMDGTLTVSGLDFRTLSREAGVPDGTPVLEFLDTASEPERQRALQVLLEHEWQDARTCRLRPGAREVVQELRERGIKTAVLTRNSRISLEVVLERFALTFDCCVTRDDAPPKPSPECVLRIADELGLEPFELLVVGDFLYDVEAGHRAGAHTAFLQTEKDWGTPPADIILFRLEDLLDYLGDSRT